MSLNEGGRRGSGYVRKALRAKRVKRFSPQLETLEHRLVLAAFSVNPSDVSNTGSGATGGLVWAINQANLAGGSNTIELAAGSKYDLTAADNNWYGPNGLPPITSDITIVGNGATIDRSAAGGIPAFRLFYISGGEELAAGSLDLENLTLANGLARGGAGGSGGGGGLGAGGAIFNQGTLLLSGVTLTNNQAIGGSAAVSGAGGGGGIGSDQLSTRGGGFGGSFSTTLGGQGGAGSSNSGAGGGGGGFLAGARGTAASGGNGGAGGGLGGFGGAGGNPAGGTAGDGGGGGGANAGNATGPAGGAFGFGGNPGTTSGGGGGVGGGGAAAIDNDGGGGGGFGGGGGGGGISGGGGGAGGFGGGGGGGVTAGAGGFAGGIGGNNLANGGGGGGLGGAIFTMGAFSSNSAAGAVTIINSTFANNSATGGKGAAAGASGGSGYGGAIFNLDGSLTFINDTLAHNTVTAGMSNGGTAGAADGAAVYNLAYGNHIDTGAAVTAAINLNNSVLADNTGGADLASNAIDGAHANSATLTGTNNLVLLTNLINTPLVGGVLTLGAEPNLPNLADNGGPTQTIAITASSPAYNAGSLAVAGLPATDQRGTGFPRINFGAVDLGAFEVQTFVSLSAAHSPFAENGGTATITATLNGTSNQNATVPLTFSGNAVQGIDFSASASSIVIAAGQTSGSITLAGLSNGSFGNSSKTVEVSEASAMNSAVGSPSTVTATIDPAVSLPASNLPDAVLGSPFNSQIIATGGDGGRYSYSVTAGALPRGLSLDPTSGVISGAATQVGSFSFTVVATDVAQPSFPPATQAFALRVLPTITLSDSHSPFSENGGTDVITATLSDPSNTDVIVPLNFSGTAVKGVDYQASASNLTISAGQTSASMVLTGLNYGGFTSSKTIVVGLGNLTNAAPGSAAAVTATIELPSTATFIQSLYVQLLGRPAEPNALTYWNQMLTAAGNTQTNRAQIVSEIETSPEYRLKEVDRLYEQYLHRTAVGDPGAPFWAAHLAAGETMEEIATQIAASPEFIATQTDGTIEGWLKAFYQDALSRPIEPAGLAFWSQAFEAGASRAQIAKTIFTATPLPGAPANEYRLHLVDSYYEQFLMRPATGDAASQNLAGQLQQGAVDEQVIAAILGSDEFFNDSV